MAEGLHNRLRMKNCKAYLNAFRRGYTYNPRRNPYLGFGFLWGVPVPLFSILLDCTLTAAAPLDALQSHPIHLLFFAHPLLFAIVFGAMGTVRQDLREENDKLIATLREEAMTDPLTGLYNRRYVLEHLKNAVIRARRTGEEVAVAMFDLDKFKAVNERHGHLYGDQVLQKVARALRAATRDCDLLGRYGGDEFLLVLLGNEEQAREVVGRATEQVAAGAGMRISVGVAGLQDAVSTELDLIREADARLKAAKRTRHATKNLARR